jgi:hypothetical protein
VEVDMKINAIPTKIYGAWYMTGNPKDYESGYVFPAPGHKILGVLSGHWTEEDLDHIRTSLQKPEGKFDYIALGTGDSVVMYDNN